MIDQSCVRHVIYECSMTSDKLSVQGFSVCYGKNKKQVKLLGDYADHVIPGGTLKDNEMYRFTAEASYGSDNVPI